VEQLLSRHFKKALRRPALTSMMNFRTNQALIPFLLLQQLFYATWLNYPVVGELTYSVLTSRRAQVQDSKNWNQQREPPNSWRGLVPLRSSRRDVETLLGNPKTQRGSTYVYETKEDVVDILYSTGPCKLSGVERWNVPADIVIRIDVRPRATMLIQDLKLDPKRYPRLPEAHPENWTLYKNDEDGLMVETILTGKVEEVYTITYWPRIKDKALHCNQ
jgi:hypothetical protein